MEFTCNTKLGRAVDLAELDMGTIMKDVVVQIANPLKKPYAFVCTTEEIIFSVRDEDFANCLIGVNNLLEE